MLLVHAEAEQEYWTKRGVGREAPKAQLICSSTLQALAAMITSAESEEPSSPLSLSLSLPLSLCLCLCLVRAQPSLPRVMAEHNYGNSS